MSLRWRILGSTVLVVAITVLASIGVGYYATQSRLGVLVARIGANESVQLARNLSRAYTEAGGWETVDRPLNEAGFIYKGLQEEQGHEASEENSSGSFHREQIRVVIVDLDGRVIRDNLLEQEHGATEPSLGGHRGTVIDLATDQPVGYVYTDVNHELLSSESQGFLNTLLYITILGGMLTVGVAALLAMWLSKRITSPVTALTEATQAIAQGDSAVLPVVSSDELGRMSAAFNRMINSLETQRELRRRLVNDVSHELNTPLSHHSAGGKRTARRTAVC